MPRIAPDGYDVLVLPLDDGPGTHINYGTAGTVGNWTDYGNPVSGAQGLLGNAMYMPSQYISSNHDGCGGGNDILVTPNITMSGWIFLRRSINYSPEIFNKQYFLNGWSNPYLTFGIQMDTANNGWTLYLTTGGTLRSLIMAGSSNTTCEIIPQGRWCHIGGTWNGTNLIAYINGHVAGATTYTGTIDYGTLGNRGQWYTGAVPGSGTNQGPPILVQDVRVANIARPASYFANIHYNGFAP